MDLFDIHIAAKAAEHRRSLIAYARALTRDSEEAEDLVQETFKKALANRSSFSDARDSGARKWLSSILRNHFRDGRRRIASRKTETVAEEILHQIPCSGSQEEAVLSIEIDQAVACLPAEQRAVFTLVMDEEKSYKDVAQDLSIPIGTVMSRLKRAREKLVRRFELAPA